ncbi:hypothetical protein INT47_008156 [Mucor saturninus]|uniref:3'-5' exonuclease domain-containing protein n=1 Tax=Mucor saturninus TaxID=64648 RepID=A0A8H7QPG0_9FUNG|nr:hypothetical protein INT47_008156 [Mucor saturninus]
MDSEFTLTTDEIWRNTIRTVEAAYCWLLTYEGKDYELVDDTITAMRKLITHGRTYESVKSYNSTKLSTPSPTSKSYKKQFYAAPISYDLEPNWQQIDKHTIEVTLNGGVKALAIAVSTEQQLDQVIRDIYAASCVAVDCEFLGQKKTLPELKLLQIGVSKEKGYAIQVDMIGPQVIADKLKPILEDQNLNIVGWAFRGDALAIESYINGIELAPVLDLQAKLLPVAMENLNLGNALNKYAGEWVGNEEFQKDKQYGNQFIFTGKECIWLRDPLPPKALVYSVFDVLSVVALYEHTLDYRSNENHYWPFTVTSTSTQKSLDKWHMQRAKGINTSNVVNVVNSKSTKISNGKEPALSTSVITDDGYNDEDERFKRAIQVALERSVKDNLPRNKRGESSTDRVISSDSPTELNYSEISQELEENPYNRNKNDLHFSDPPPEEASTIPEIVEGTWGTESLDDQPFFGSAFKNKTIKSPDDVAAANAATAATETDKVSTFSANTPVAISSEKPITILKRPQASATVPKSYNNSPIPPPSTARATDVANKQWQMESVPVPVSESTAKHQWKVENAPVETSQWGNYSPVPPVAAASATTTTTATSVAAFPNKGRKLENYTKGQWNTKATPKHNWNLDDQESPDVKNNYSNHWNKNVEPSNKWDENTGNNQWGNVGSSNQWSNEPSRSRNSGYKSPKPSNLSPRVPEKLLVSPSASRSSTRKSPAMSDRSPQNQYASCKPDKNKYTNDLKNRINVGSQTGSFTTWSPSNKNEMSSASWKSFASTSIKDWGEGKDTSLGAIETVSTKETSPIPEPIPFNTTVQSNYPRGGNIGDSSTGKMKEMDNWAQEDERPDTMQMPMNQIPIRTTFSGPKVINPNDDNDDEDDEDDDDYIGHDNFDAGFPILKMNMAIQDKSQTKKIDSGKPLPTFVDGIFLYSEDGDAELSMYIMTKPEELDMIRMPPKDQDFTATICYHFISSNNQRIIKAIQIYLSTGDSYTAMVEKTFMMKKPGTFKHTKFAQLLTDPSIKRVCWCPSFIEEEMYRLLGFTIGPCIDLMNRANFNREHPHYFSFIGAVDYFLQDWPDKKQFDDAKADYDAIIAKKFSSTCWDREKLPDAVLTYCALQGLAAYTLYCRTVQQIDAPDSLFMYETDMQ